jgi:trehalose 6-phosphate phosphatase
MQALSRDIDLELFFRTVSESPLRVLLLDYDGTLAPFTVHRDKAHPYRGVRELINEILELPGTRTAFVTGRTVADLTRLLGLRSSAEIWGSHGWEHLTREGVYTRFQLDAQSQERLLRAREFLSALSSQACPNLREDKEVSVAAHWRGLPAAEVERLRPRILAVFQELAAGTGMETHAFDGGLELRPRGHDKGSAVSQVLASISGACVASYLGDDLTDEDAFKALDGRGLRVLVRDQLRSTLADLWARPPEELVEYLTAWRDACAGATPALAVGQ